MGVSPYIQGVQQNLTKADQAYRYHVPSNAANALVVVLNYYPYRKDLWEFAGNYAFQAGNYHESIVFFDRTSRLGTLSVNSQIALGEAELQTGKLDQAMRVLYPLLDVDTTHNAETLLEQMIDAYLQADDYESASDLLIKMLQINPTNANTYHKLGILNLALDPTSAMVYLEQASLLDPTYQENTTILLDKIKTARRYDDPSFLYLEAGRALGSLGLWKYSARSILTAVEINPEFAEAWAFLGEAYQHIDLDGLDHLNRAMRINPKSVVVQSLQSLYWKRQNNYALALLHLQVAMRYDPDNPVLQTEMGNILSIMGDYNQAVSYYLKATELEPQNPLYWKMLGEFSLKNSFQVQLYGIPAARKAVLIDPDDPEALDLIGQAFFQTGDGHSAVRYYQQALLVNPEFSPAYYHLGLLFLASRDDTQAKTYLRRAATIGKGTPSGKQAWYILQRYLP